MVNFIIGKKKGIGLSWFLWRYGFGGNLLKLVILGDILWVRVSFISFYLLLVLLWMSSNVIESFLYCYVNIFCCINVICFLMFWISSFRERFYGFDIDLGR